MNVFFRDEFIENDGFIRASGKTADVRDLCERENHPAGRYDRLLIFIVVYRQEFPFFEDRGMIIRLEYFIRIRFRAGDHIKFFRRPAKKNMRDIMVKMEFQRSVCFADLPGPDDHF